MNDIDAFLLSPLEMMLSKSIPDFEIGNIKHARILAKTVLMKYYDIFTETFSAFPTESVKSRITRTLAANGVDMSKSNSLVYGNIEFFSYLNLLERLDLQKGQKLVDLGHGTGKASIASFIAYSDILDNISGIEIVPDLFNMSIEALGKFKTVLGNFSGLFPCNFDKIHFFLGDMLSEQYSLLIKDAGLRLEMIFHFVFFHFLLSYSFFVFLFYLDVIFVNSTCFDSQLMCALADLCMGMKLNSKVITLTQSLPNPSFKIIYSENFAMSWGIATCFIHEKCL